MIRLALTTFPSEAAAEHAVRSLVADSLAACGTILPGARSIYRWQGRIEDDGEVLVIFKLPAAGADAFSQRLKELHPYEVPEIVFLRPEEVDPAYGRWILASGGPSPAEPGPS